jgi:hypothetical protein
MESTSPDVGTSTTGVVESDHDFAGQIREAHVKYIAFIKGKNFPEEHRDYSLEEDLGKH